MTSYKELDVWQKSVRLAVEVYRATRRLLTEEKFGDDSIAPRGKLNSSKHRRGLGAGITEGVRPILAAGQGIA
jgi:23S rRNA-intervening sequence protein